MTPEHITIDPVTNAKTMAEFLALPPRLYKSYPEYIPPLTLDRRGLLDPKKAPFFKHGEAQFWIARRGGQAVGRISAQLDHAQPGGDFAGAGLFGCLDTIDDEAVVRALLSVAEDALRAKGCLRAMGPLTLSMNSEPGLMIGGQTEPPQIGTSWHPSYIEAHLNACGYDYAKDLHYWRISTQSDSFPALRDRPKIQDRLKGYTIRKIDLGNIASEIKIIREVYNDAWLENWGFVPLTEADLAAMASELKPYLRAEFGAIVERDGAPVGVGLLVPNLYEITSDLGPNPSPWGWVKLLWRTVFHRFSSGRLIVLGVRAELKHSVAGAVVAMALVEELFKGLTSYQPRDGWAEAGWVLDDNTAVIRLLEQIGFSKSRTFRIMKKDIGATEQADNRDG